MKKFLIIVLSIFICSCGNVNKEQKLTEVNPIDTVIDNHNELLDRFVKANDFLIPPPKKEIPKNKVSIKYVEVKVPKYISGETKTEAYKQEPVISINIHPEEEEIIIASKKFLKQENIPDTIYVHDTIYIKVNWLGKKTIINP